MDRQVGRLIDGQAGRQTDRRVVRRPNKRINCNRRTGLKNGKGNNGRIPVPKRPVGRHRVHNSSLMKERDGHIWRRGRGGGCGSTEGETDSAILRRSLHIPGRNIAACDT